MTREIAFDTETTGLDPRAGHRLVEIGCVELIHGMPSGRSWHSYLNPERDMPEEAFAVHGLSVDFLQDKPLFGDVAEGFLEFVADATLVIHNAAFDLGFINAELDRIGRPALSNAFVDTVSVARRKFPGQRNSLDALCERFGIDNAHRTRHGALLDAELLAEVYVELNGGRQRGLDLAATTTTVTVQVSEGAVAVSVVREARVHAPSAAELAAHEAFLKKLSEPIWLK
ncbi:MAG: DNA polymerase III subunit epsilon [Alphaproteobacteria bacterium]|nr:DNA polymerase III subunit epsilon [Alphaproteobacteria bacterium]MCW5741170.1 DNA polymerase III subunit epsilon [Alphaproteobacteria bacterium]